MITSARLSLILIFIATVGALAADAQKPPRSYMDTTLHFRFEYPSDFKVLKGASAKTDTAYGDPGNGRKLLSVTPVNIPNRYHGSYEFNVWSSTDPKVKCGAIEQEEGEFSLSAPDDKPRTRVIDGKTFYAYTGEEAGMSKDLSLSGYRSLIDGKCWQIQLLTYQVGAFDDFKAFDQKIIDDAFDKFVSGFTFK